MPAIFNFFNPVGKCGDLANYRDKCVTVNGREFCTFRVLLGKELRKQIQFAAADPHNSVTVAAKAPVMILVLNSGNGSCARR